MPERLVLCSGAKRAGGNSTLMLALSGRSQNITLKLEDISKKMVRNVPDLLIDLIEIATYVYCADQATSRGGPAQVGMGDVSCTRSRLYLILQTVPFWRWPVRC